MNILQLVYLACSKPDEAFIQSLFRYILHREADPGSLHAHMGLLAAGMTRIEMLSGLIQGVEARAIYYGPPVLHEMPTIANKLRHLLTLPPAHIVHHYYVELLARMPDPGGFQGHLQRLQHGYDPVALAADFMASEEFRQLVHAAPDTLGRRFIQHALQF